MLQRGVGFCFVLFCLFTAFYFLVVFLRIVGVCSMFVVGFSSTVRCTHYVVSVLCLYSFKMLFVWLCSCVLVLRMEYCYKMERCMHCVVFVLFLCSNIMLFICVVM